MEIKTKYNVGDKVWIMRNNKPEKIQISNIEVEVIGDVPVGTCSLSGEYYTKIIYVEVQRSEYRSFGDKDPICKHNECNCFNTKKDLHKNGSPFQFNSWKSKACLQSLQW